MPRLAGAGRRAPLAHNRFECATHANERGVLADDGDCLRPRPKQRLMYGPDPHRVPITFQREQTATDKGIDERCTSLLPVLELCAVKRSDDGQGCAGRDVDSDIAYQG